MPKKFKTNVIKQPYWECRFIDMEYVEERKRKMPIQLWQQEFCCIFNVDDGYAFDYPLIEKACTLPSLAHEWSEKAMYFAGMDLGRRVDHSVLTIFEGIGPMRRMVFHYVWDLNLPWTQIAAEALYYLQAWKPKYTIVDATGPGRPTFEAFFRSMSNVEGWIYTLDNKAELMRNLLILLEKERLMMWKEESLMDEFQKVPEKRLPSGKAQFPKPESGHDDQVQSVALALMAAAMYLGDDNVDQSIAYDAVSKDLGHFGGPNPFYEQQQNASSFQKPINPRVVGGRSPHAQTSAGSIWEDPNWY